MNSEHKIDKPLMAISLSVILFVVVGLTLFPEQGNAIASQLFSTLTNQFGEVFLFFGFFSVIFLAKIALGKYGEIKLGDDKPEYSQFTYLAMMVCAGLGSATVYWAFVEWGGYYYMTPPFDVEPYSPMAAEWGDKLQHVPLGGDFSLVIVLYCLTTGSLLFPREEKPAT